MFFFIFLPRPIINGRIDSPFAKRKLTKRQDDQKQFKAVKGLRNLTPKSYFQKQYG